ncbi:MAG TPA: hypothetical protein VJ944_05915 [Thermoplasmataceae archaeon]|nr:hypothetical protein [Thermoplasmataceae archaeon]
MNRYYKPKWKVQQQNIPSETLKSNRNLRKFLRIRKTIFMFNIVVSAIVLAFILAGVL